MKIFFWSYLVALMVVTPGAFAQNRAAIPEKEWTILVFLNGHNNLDDAGHKDMNEMEKVGSTDQINVVVQWASLKNKATKRIYVEKDTNARKVSSPVVETLDPVDMGDWKNLVEFVRWGVERYPAKRYFIDVWNHGAGWHLARAAGASTVSPLDISFDDITRNFITTEQLGDAMRESARIIGHNVDIYGSDACLMAMLEVAQEMTGAVDVFVGAEEVEPADGWPYDEFLKKWTKKPTAAAAEVGRMLVDAYADSYSGGSQGRSEITLSALDLNRIAPVNTALRALGNEIALFPASELDKLNAAAEKTIYFTNEDYRDLLHFVDIAARTTRLGNSAAVKQVNEAVSRLVIHNRTTRKYADAKGVAVWLPTSRWMVDAYRARYQGLKFNAESNWLGVVDALSSVFPPRPW